MNFFEKWDSALEGGLQRLVERSLGRGSSADFLESYSQALEEVETRAMSVGGGRVFPHKRVVMRFSVATANEAAVLNGIFANRKQISKEVRHRLESSGCAVGDVLRIDASAVVGSDAGLQPAAGQVECEDHLPPRPGLALCVVEGMAEQGRYAFSEPVVNIGRLAEILDERRFLVRRNHVVFPDRESGINATVSRMHAHIVFDDETGWRRVFDDGSRFGTRIWRNGRIIEVPAGTGGGAWLRDGDELHVGQARMKVEIDAE